MTETTENNTAEFIAGAKAMLNHVLRCSRRHGMRYVSPLTEETLTDDRYIESFLMEFAKTQNITWSEEDLKDLAEDIADWIKDTIDEDVLHT